MNPSLPRVAVVGSGYWGKNLVRNFSALGALAAVFDRDEAKLAAVRDNYPGVKTCVALHEILSDPEIDAAVIATPAETHYALAKELLLAGKHLFVEKPLVLNEEEGEELIDLADRGDRVLMVGHLLRYHPAFIALSELVGSGALGKINYIYSNRLNLGKIRREENILWSFAPHDISMILALAGELPDSVFATGGNYLHTRIADVTTTHMAFPSGMRAHIFVSWLHPFKEQKLVVVGERKMAVLDDTQPWPGKLLLYPHEIRWENNIPIPARAEAEQVPLPVSEPLKLECEHFLSCVAQGRKPITDGREGLDVLRVLQASQRSLDTGETVRPGILAPGRFPTGVFVHETAVVDKGAVLGAGTKIWHFSHVLPGSKIGEGVNIGQNVSIGPDVTIGDGCKIQNNVSVYKGVTLEEDVFCGPSIVFTNIMNPRAHISRMHEARPTLVQRGASLGANSTVVCGRTVGRCAFVGAGAVVTRDVPDHALVVGNPARRIGWMCACGGRLDENLSCPECGTVHKHSGEGLAVVS